MLLSPFSGISLITHILICSVYKTALFFYGMFGGFKGKKNTQLMLLVRNRNEKILPAMMISLILSTITGIAFFSAGRIYQNKPNTFDLVASTMDTTQIYESLETDMPVLKKHTQNKQFLPPVRIEKTMIASGSF